MPRRRSQPKLRAMVPCGYCFSQWASCYDHILPVSVGGTNRGDNLYPSCQRCNGLLSNMVFPSLDAKRDYVRDVLVKRGQWVENPQLVFQAGFTSGFVYGLTRCLQCGGPMNVKRSNAKFCSQKCKWTWNNHKHPRTNLGIAIRSLQESYLTLEEAAKLGYGSVSTLRRKIKKGLIESHNFFGKIIIKRQK